MINRTSSFSFPGMFSVLIIFGLGAGAGIVVSIVGGLETRWLVYVCGAVFFATVTLMVSDREKLFWGLFVLSFQLDIYVRIMHGYANSHGIAFPASFLTGLLLLSWYFTVGDLRRFQPLKWGGVLGFPIVLLFITSFFSLLMSSEKFITATALFTHIQYYVIYFIALNFITTERSVNFIIKLLLITLIIQSIVYFIQSSMGITFTLTGKSINSLAPGEVPRPGGTVATTPAGFASFILPLLLIAMAHFVSCHKDYPQTIIGIITMLGVGALVITYTRAAWGSFVLGAIWLLAFSFRRKALSMPKFFLILGVAAIAVIIAIPMIMARLEGAPLEGSYKERLNLMLMALVLIKLYPFFGVGLGAYGEVYTRHIPPELDGYWLFTVHNYYLLRTAETGIIGGFAFILLMILGIRLALRVSKSSSSVLANTGLGFSAALIGLSFEMYWDTWTDFTYNALFWFLLGLMGALENIMKQNEK